MPDRERRPRSIPPTVTYPLVAVAAMIAVFYGLYVPLTARQERSFNDLAFRSVASVADQLQGRVSNYVLALSQAERIFIDAPQGDLQPLSSIASGSSGSEAVKKVVAGRRASWDSYIDDQLRGLRRVPCSEADLQPDFQLAGENETSLLIQRTGTEYEFLLVRRGCAVSSIANVMEDLLSSIPENVFDEFLIADAKGRVVFQTTRTGLRVDSLESTPFRAPPSRQDSENAQDSAENPDPPSLTFDKIRTATHWLETVLQGRRYYAYTAPLSISFLKDDRSPLVLCGLVHRDRFSTMVMRAPSSWLITASMVLFIIVFSSWPLLRHKAMTAGERIPRNTGLYYILSTAVTIVVAFLLCVHLCYLLDYDETGEKLQSLANSINDHLSDEVNRSLDVLEAAERLGGFDGLKETDSFKDEQNYLRCLKPDQGTRPDYCKVDLLDPQSGGGMESKQDSILTRSIVETYPYFDLIFWSDRIAGQHAKWSVRRTLTPPTPLGGIPFYAATLRDDYWKLHGTGSSPRRFRVDPVYSPNNGEYLTVVSRPVGKHAAFLNAGHLVTPLMSLVRPVLPPHFGFAVVDQRGGVLFHTIAAKNLRENFIDQTSDPGQVREAVRSGQVRHFPSRFSGSTYRLLVSPVTISPDIPWSLIVFFDQSASRAQHIATMLSFSFMAAAYYALLALVSFAGLTLLREKRGYATVGIWPEKDQASLYLHLCLAFAVVLLASFWIVLDLPSYLSLFAAAFVPIFTLAMAKKFLTPNSDLTRAAFLGAVTFFASIGLAFWQDSGLDFVAAKLPWSSLAAGVVIFLSYASLGKQRLPRLERNVAGRWYFFFYTAACVEILLLFAFIPSLAFYKLAWDVQERLFTQREQLGVLRAIEERRTRLSQYYSDVQLPRDSAFLRTLLDEEILDRYDHQWAEPLTGPPPSLRAWRPLTTLDLGRFFLPIAKTSVEQELENSVGSRWRSSEAGGRLYRWRAGSEMERATDVSSGQQGVVSSLRELTVRDFLRRMGAAVLVLVVLAFFWTRESLRQLFGLDFRLGDAWLPLDLRASFPLSRRVIMIGDPRGGKSNAISAWPDQIFRLDMAQVINDKQTRFEPIQQPIVALDHFEYQIDDAEATAVKLDTFRRFSYTERKRVYIVSTVDPVFYWEDSHSRQTRLSPEEHQHAEKNREAAIELRSVERVRLVAADDNSAADLNRLWLSCSPSEKVALLQLAHEAWPNFKNADALRHLWNRGILSRDKCREQPHERFRFCDSRFQEFVLNTVSSHEKTKLAQRQATSSWAGIQSAFVILVFGALAATVLLLGHQMWGTIITVAGALMTAIRLVTAMRGQGLLAMLSKDVEKA